MKPTRHNHGWQIRKPTMRKLLCLAGLVGTSFIGHSAAETESKRAGSRDQAPLSPETVPRVTDYILSARLDPERKEVRGTGRIVFRNPSNKPTRALYFHLYLNAFESDETLFLRKKASRSGQRQGERGGITVHSLSSSALGGTNLWPKDAHTPSDPKDRTDIRVELPRPLRGSEVIELDVAFTSKLPQVVERTGWERDFFLVAQWYPKLAKREPSGKWAHFPFHPHGEFYSDFGDYDVTLEVPDRFVVGSTGELVELEPTSDDVKRYRAIARGVHDFAWTAWPGFHAETRDLDGVATRVLSPPDTPRLREKTWATLERGLEHLEGAYGDYPHPALTVVIPPAYAFRAGGMEYPQFITTGGSEPRTYLGVRDVELLTIHELAHQWFQGMIASNEMAHPFLDEGLTSYAESRYLEEVYGDGALLSILGLNISRTAGSRYVNARHPGKHPIASAASVFDDFRSIGSLVYARSALCLETLRRVYGTDELNEVLSTYADRYRFRHPRPADFYAVFEEVLGPAVRRQVELMFEQEGDIDYEVSSIDTRRDDGAFVSKVEVLKSGTLSLPTFVRVALEDGSSETIPVPAIEGGHTIRIRHQSPIRFAEVDPENRVLLDRDLLNNRGTPSGKSPDRDQQFHSALAVTSWALSWFSP